MQNKVEVSKQQDCIHHWIIEPPDGDMSYGTCKHCGRVAVFYNTYVTDFVKHAKQLEEMPTQPIN